jgi:bifunctional non-homologous end joining protein LigD
VKTGRTIEQVSVAPERTWRSNRAQSAASKKPRSARSARNARSATRATRQLRGVQLPVLQRIALTHPDRVLYRAQGITKAELALYYAQVAERMLPHLADRPLMLVRCPEGADRTCFHQKHPKDSTSRAIHRVRIREKSGTREHMTVDDAEGLIALVQIGALELHTWGSRATDLEHPDQLTFDLDPDEGLPWSRVTETALALRERLLAHDLPSYLKTTGGKGLHVVVPIAPRSEWPAVKEFCKAFVDAWVREAPTRYVANVSKAQRRGKILLDYLRNGRGATAVCAYSTRARSGAPVATPLAWNELERIDPQTLTIRSVPARIAAQKRDPWHGFFAAPPSLPVARSRASRHRAA